MKFTEEKLERAFTELFHFGFVQLKKLMPRRFTDWEDFFGHQLSFELCAILERLRNFTDKNKTSKICSEYNT